MRKIATATLEERPNGQGRRIKGVLVFTLILSLSPVLYEVGLLCFASWKGLVGAYPHVQTPVIDLLRDGYSTASLDFKQMFTGLFRQSPWKSSYVITFAAFWTCGLAMLLRKG